VAFSGAAGRQNTDAIRFTFTGAGGTLTYVGLFDAAYGGNSLAWAALDHAAMMTRAAWLPSTPAAWH
jgi:hypothetical protein